ncbi:hypothetical protein AM10699_25430 [Acaryochloris marina MBIC10699]|nr:hypothetical protein AM10699_25430 [Acaryochloris marina MBIC10699]
MEICAQINSFGALNRLPTCASLDTEVQGYLPVAFKTWTGRIDSLDHYDVDCSEALTATGMKGQAEGKDGGKFLCLSVGN